MFKYKLSGREKILVGALAVIILFLLWFMLVFQRTNDEVNRINSEISTIEMENTTNQQMLANMQSMEESIAEHKARGDKTVVIPKYDNTQHLMAELNAVLGATDTMKLQFGEVDLESSDYVLRPVQITFGCDSYATVENIARALATGTYPCAITEINFNDNTNTGATGARMVSSSDGSSNYSASLKAVFFEEKTEEMLAAERQKAAEEEAAAEAGSKA